MKENDKDTEETTWIKIGEVAQGILDRLIEQQEHDERVKRLKEALEEVE